MRAPGDQGANGAVARSDAQLGPLGPVRHAAYGEADSHPGDPKPVVRPALSQGAKPSQLLGHSDVKTTMISTHGLNRGPAGVRSPVDGL